MTEMKDVTSQYISFIYCHLLAHGWRQRVDLTNQTCSLDKHKKKNMRRLEQQALLSERS